MTAAILVAIWAGICAVDDVGTQMIRRPLLIATVVGLIMGDLTTGLMIGATLEVMWMGVGNVGAYSAPDMISGTAIGTALGIASGSRNLRSWDRRKDHSGSWYRPADADDDQESRIMAVFDCRFYNGSLLKAFRTAHHSDCFTNRVDL